MEVLIFINDDQIIFNITAVEEVDVENSVLDLIPTTSQSKAVLSKYIDRFKIQEKTIHGFIFL